MLLFLGRTHGWKKESKFVTVSEQCQSLPPTVLTDFNSLAYRSTGSNGRRGSTGRGDYGNRGTNSNYHF
jgi:hypothetical protein